MSKAVVLENYCWAFHKKTEQKAWKPRKTDGQQTGSRAADQELLWKQYRKRRVPRNILTHKRLGSAGLKTVQLLKMADGEPMNNGREQLPFALVRASSEHRELTSVWKTYWMWNTMTFLLQELNLSLQSCVFHKWQFPMRSVYFDCHCYTVHKNLALKSVKRWWHMQELMQSYQAAGMWWCLIQLLRRQSLWFTDEKIFTKESS